MVRMKYYNEQWSLKLDWRLGDQVPEELLDCDRQEYKVAILEEFGIDAFDRSREEPVARKWPQPWERPEDLEIASPSLLK